LQRAHYLHAYADITDAIAHLFDQQGIRRRRLAAPDLDVGERLV
jgi:hypothetical protein